MSHNHRIISGTADPLWDSAAYATPEAARIVKIGVSRARRWLQGYEYRYAPVAGRVSVRTQKPLVRRGMTQGTRYASFLDLMDLLFVKQFLNYGLSLQKVRKALDETTDLLGTTRFAQETFFTNGHNIYLKVRQKGNAILELLSGGQWVIPGIIEDLSHRIDFDEDTGFARRWFPLSQTRRIVVDPQVSFGRPSIANSGIATANVYDLFVAEARNTKQVCSWFSLDRQAVLAAVEFEESLAA